MLIDDVDVWLGEIDSRLLFLESIGITKSKGLSSRKDSSSDASEVARSQTSMSEEGLSQSDRVTVFVHNYHRVKADL